MKGKIALEVLIADFVKVDDANQAAAAGLPSPFWSVKWDFVLADCCQNY